MVLALNIAQIHPQQQYLHLQTGLLKKVILVTLNMSAAFDLLDKSILIPKVRAHEFPERVIAIYIEFLSDRKGVVQVQDESPLLNHLTKKWAICKGSTSGPLLLSLLVNNIFEELQLGKTVRYAYDSYLIFEGDSWDEVCKIASTEATCVLDWLQDFGMVVNSLKTEAMYFPT
jgi:hypothetical protein